MVRVGPLKLWCARDLATMQAVVQQAWDSSSLSSSTWCWCIWSPDHTLSSKGFKHSGHSILGHSDQFKCLVPPPSSAWHRALHTARAGWAHRCWLSALEWWTAVHLTCFHLGGPFAPDAALIWQLVPGIPSLASQSLAGSCAVHIGLWSQEEMETAGWEVVGGWCYPKALKNLLYLLKHSLQVLQGVGMLVI